MNVQIREFSLLTGVSVRTLHYYDEIGLLKPSFVDANNGYRFYDDESLMRMQEILFYRELDFPLRSIQEILSSPNYDKVEALKKQRELLIIKQQRLNKLIAAVDRAVEGEVCMKAFDNREFETKRKQYQQEAKEKWGKTDAYAEYEQKAKSRSEQDQNRMAAGLDAVFSEFAACLQDGLEPQDAQTQELVKKLQSYITENYYTCSKEILAGLGQMYVADERFQKNIDRHAPGTAAFAAQAIDLFCREREGE